MPDTIPIVDLSNALADAASRAGASTVTVDARRRFPASGILYARDLVLTADHAVEREESIRVFLPRGTKVDASLAGRDAGTDLALLRLADPVPEADFHPVEIPASPTRVGQIVLALGRPGLDGIQASLGVLSAIGGPLRTGRGGLLDQYLRTDAIPLPGFSGGPLVDAGGNILGLNTSGLARGASLAIPLALAWEIATALAERGHVSRGYLGIRSQPVDLPPTQRGSLGRDQSSGLLLVGIESGSPAEQGGLMVGDILVAINEQPVADPDDLLVRLGGALAGKPASIQVLRAGKPQTVMVTIGERSAR